jgi:glutaredoxin 3
MFIIYTKDKCSYCVKAKELLTSKGYDYKEKNIANDAYRSDLLFKLPEVKTVPQIFYGNKHIGGFDALTEYFNQNI